MKKTCLICLLIIFCVGVSAQKKPKREFRGAWIQTVYQPQYAAMNPDEMRCYFDTLTLRLQQAGINALIFQVRPEADAFYPSEIEPWSRFLTGEQGVAPAPLWDPMQYLITLCHERDMEFHAWINPYRVSVNNKNRLAPGHIYHSHPEWFVTYGNQLVFDPGLPESRAFICRVVDDMVSRYDIDAIHMDDYFYPYPVSGTPFPDTDSYRRYGGNLPLDEWRRDNVNRLVSELSLLIKKRKPWVRFGISPFGIYRNDTSWEGGSPTAGLQNYDDLYADVLLWVRNGWVDYIVPQLYWEVGHPAACYEKLVYWWNEAVGDSPCHLYIGQDVNRSLHHSVGGMEYPQISHKLLLSRYLSSVAGNCFWSGYNFLDDYEYLTAQLKEDFFSRSVLMPAYTGIDSIPPARVAKLQAHWGPEGYFLEWKSDAARDEMQKARYYCIYRFRRDEAVDINNVDALVARVREPRFRLDYNDGSETCVYAVTAVDRMYNESQPRTIKVKL